MRATESAALAGSAASEFTLRTWLQATLQIHAKCAFRSAVEAQRSFSEISRMRETRSEGAAALQAFIRMTCAEPAGQAR
jgi:ATP-dependent protease HslVU (ClpYQ) peptidase subunit